MAIGKWIGGFLGFISGGPLGALAGIALGSLFDLGLDKVNTSDNYSSKPYDEQTNQRFSAHRHHTTDAREQEGERNSFLFSLLVLAAYIIRADGKVMHSEMEMLRGFLRNNFGAAAVGQGEQIILRLFEQQKQMGVYQFENVIRQSCLQIRAHMDGSRRLQLLNFLALLAQADGHIDATEVQALRNVALWMGLHAGEADAMLNLKKTDLNSAYTVLGLTPNATEAEVKAAYRKMALQHHPDRVATLGEDVRKAAEKKFKEIADAKERIYQARGWA